MSTLTDLIAKLDENVQVRGRQFEHICKWYLENDPKYKLELKRVWLWNEWPGRWGPDAGIDLVAQTYDKKIWAIQAKAYKEKYSIKKSDIDTFLSESSREVFSYRLLIAKTNFIGRTAERTLHDQEKAVGRVLLSDLEKSEVEWPESPQRLVAKPHKRKKPLTQQQKAISDVCKGFSDNGRGQIIMACGTGKTLVALWVAEKLQSQRTLVLLPSLSLLAQTLREWTANASQSFRYLPVCSDDTVRGEDRLVSKTSDLGLPVTTDPDEVAAFIRQRVCLVVFATYQSSPVIADAFHRDHVPSFDLAIADEAHRCAGPVSGTFATILDATAIKAKRRLFMTATPRYFTDRVRKEAELVDFEIASMDDERKFGSVFHRLSFSEAIEQDLLSDYQVVIVGVDECTYREYAEKGKLVTTDGEKITDARTLASHIALAKAMSKYDLKRVVSFHGRIKRAKEFSDRLPDVIHWMAGNSRPSGEIWSKHVSGEMPAGRRDVLLNRFRHLDDGERGLLANARCLAEGIDLPTLDGVAFIDPRSSQTDIVQAVGRAIRKAPDKKVGTVVLPVFIEAYENAETALDSSVFKPIWNVLKALRAHDEVLGETLDQLRSQIGRYGNKGLALPKKLCIDLPVQVGKSFADCFCVKLVEQSTASWEFWFSVLEDYVQREGDSLVPIWHATEDGYKLGRFLSYQRRRYKQGKLSAKRQQALEQLRGWTWDAFETAWSKGFGRLQQYAQHKGNTLVPEGHLSYDGYPLGKWVKILRDRGRKGRLSEEQMKALEQFQDWTWNTLEAKWISGLKLLQEYVEREGNALVPQGYVTDHGFKLGHWVSMQRQGYRRKKLSGERQQLLEQIPGWKWHKLDAEWEDGFRRLRKYAQCEKHTIIPIKYVTKDRFPLGQWVNVKRSCYRSGKLSVLHQKQLEQLPGWRWYQFNAYRQQHRAYWQRNFELLLEYVQQRGTSIVSPLYVTKGGFRLGKWVFGQRRAHLKGKLSTEQQESLEKLPGWTWDPLGLAWAKGLELLQEYVKQEGNALVPSGYVTGDGYRLGDWVSRQRKSYRLGKMSADQEKTLERLPEWTWKPSIGSSVYDARWYEWLKRLEKYIERKGHASVPARCITEDGFKLGEWVSEQRKKYRRGKLSAEKQKALEQLAGWEWNPLDEQWQIGFKLLCEYVELNGDAVVTREYVTGAGFKLGQWVSTQRERYKRGRLSREQVQALEHLHGWKWNRVSAYWEEAFERLCQFAEHNGHALVHQHYVTEDGYKLGHWVSTQRQGYRKGRLSAGHEKDLEQVPGWVWDARNARWSEALKCVQKFVEREGHALVPEDYVTKDGYNLGRWVQQQRNSYRKRKLSSKRQSALEQLPGWKWKTNESTWIEGFTSLREYVEQKGDAVVPQSYVTEDGYNLGTWVHSKRQAYLKGKLSRESIQAIERLPGWVWDARKTHTKTKK